MQRVEINRVQLVHIKRAESNIKLFNQLLFKKKKKSGTVFEFSRESESFNKVCGDFKLWFLISYIHTCQSKYVLKRVSFGSKECTKELKLERAYFLGQTS